MQKIRLSLLVSDRKFKVWYASFLNTLLQYNERDKIEGKAITSPIQNLYVVLAVHTSAISDLCVSMSVITTTIHFSMMLMGCKNKLISVLPMAGSSANTRLTQPLIQRVSFYYRLIINYILVLYKIIKRMNGLHTFSVLCECDKS